MVVLNLHFKMLFNLEALDNFGNFFKYCVGKTWDDRHISSRVVSDIYPMGTLLQDERRNFKLYFFKGIKIISYFK